MKGRESGMPKKEMWERFFHPAKVLKALGLDEKINDVAEFGCGYGTFTMPAARTVKGTIYAIDIEADMVHGTEKEAGRAGLRNIKTILRDFMAEGTGLKDASVDYVMLFNILHLEKPVSLLLEAYRILKKGGKAGIIHWNYDPSTPRGPAMDIRPRPEQCIEWAKQAGFTEPTQFDLKPYHYGILLSKKDRMA